MSSLGIRTETLPEGFFDDPIMDAKVQYALCTSYFSTYCSIALSDFDLAVAFTFP